MFILGFLGLMSISTGKTGKSACFCIFPIINPGLWSWFSPYFSVNSLEDQRWNSMEKNTHRNPWKFQNITIHKKKKWTSLPTFVLLPNWWLFWEIFGSPRLISWWFKRHCSPPILVLEPNCAGWICITPPWFVKQDLPGAESLGNLRLLKKGPKRLFRGFVGMTYYPVGDYFINHYKDPY